MRCARLIAMGLVLFGLIWRPTLAGGQEPSIVIRQTPPECTATEAAVQFEGPQSQAIVRSEPKIITSTFTITATAGTLPASVILDASVESTTVYTNGIKSTTTPPIHQVAAPGATFTVPMRFVVPENAIAVHLNTKVKLSCEGQTLATGTQTFVWQRNTVLLPLVDK